MSTKPEKMQRFAIFFQSVLRLWMKLPCTSSRGTAILSNHTKSRPWWKFVVIVFVRINDVWKDLT